MTHRIFASLCKAGLSVGELGNFYCLLSYSNCAVFSILVFLFCFLFFFFCHDSHCTQIPMIQSTYVVVLDHTGLWAGISSLLKDNAEERDVRYCAVVWKTGH